MKRGRMALIGGITAVCSLALSPALSAMLRGISPEAKTPVSLKMLGSIGSFTPVTNDDRLARAYARAARESRSRGFRFTPTSNSIGGDSLTILVRAPSRGLTGTNGERVLPNLGIAPVAYRLGGSKSLAQFTAGTRLEPNELRPVIDTPVSEPVASYTLHPKKDRLSANLQLQHRDAALATPAEDAPQTLGSEQTYAVDLSSSYSLTRNLNVQAGVRYKGPSNRLAPTITDQARDSQAVYVGTIFKF